MLCVVTQSFLFVELSSQEEFYRQFQTIIKCSDYQTAANLKAETAYIQDLIMTLNTQVEENTELDHVNDVHKIEICNLKEQNMCPHFSHRSYNTITHVSNTINTDNKEDFW